MRPFGLISTSGRPFAFWLPDSAQRDLHEIDLNLGGHIGIDLPGLTDRDRRK